MKTFLCSLILLLAFAATQAKEASSVSPCSGSDCTTIKPTTIKVDAKSTNAPKNLKANGDAFQNRLNTVATDCKKEQNAQQGTPDLMALIASGAVPTNEKQRCFLECVYQKIGLIKDGKLNEEGVMSLAKQKFGENKDMLAKADALFKKCKTEAVVTEKDAKEKCALGRLIRTCIVNNGKDLPIFSAKA